MTISDLLVSAYDPPPLDSPPETLETVCALTGAPITEGYPVSSITTGKTSEMLDCFRQGLEGYVSVNTARCFKSANPRAGNPLAKSLAVIEGERGLYPLINRAEAVKQGRPSWSDWVREAEAYRGRRCALLLTTNTKRRLWPWMRVGTLGDRTPLLYFDSETHSFQNLFLDWRRLIETLEEVEAAYDAGFSKVAIRQSLYLSLKTAQEAGIAWTRGAESRIAPLRAMPEFRVAVLVAQRKIA